MAIGMKGPVNFSTVATMKPAPLTGKPRAAMPIVGKVTWEYNDSLGNEIMLLANRDDALEILDKMRKYIVRECPPARPRRKR